MRDLNLPAHQLSLTPEEHAKIGEMAELTEQFRILLASAGKSLTGKSYEEWLELSNDNFPKQLNALSLHAIEDPELKELLDELSEKGSVALTRRNQFVHAAWGFNTELGRVAGFDAKRRAVINFDDAEAAIRGLRELTWIAKEILMRAASLVQIDKRAAGSLDEPGPWVGTSTGNLKL
ncbi:hypothetical protein [Caulobacter sp. CCUG 60055]|uniref:hypothetical protein n=1 Tax=Caulobacter sp. CCUG 60055 TaxID=2100090 RepID=UPI001FA778D1|nr:hypothetical protein [Caulobacter sp. CCUG 60055]MBQ1540833.1 hypothetical protein [Caulobacteraceae bacterium]